MSCRGYEASQWYGVGVPKNTPIEIVDKLNNEINAGLANPKLRAQLADLDDRFHESCHNGGIRLDSRTPI
jgi:Tripartite tricarboxylate transporter family receptor